MNHGVFVIFKFEDGEEKLPWVHVKQKELMQYAAMIQSDNRATAVTGRKALCSVAQELYDLKMELFIERLKKDEVSRKRSNAGRAGAESRWGERDDVRKIIAGLAMSTDALGDPLPPSELWSEFFASLDTEGLSPDECANRITWDGNTKGISFKTFSNKICTARGAVEI